MKNTAKLLEQLTTDELYDLLLDKTLGGTGSVKGAELAEALRADMSAILGARCKKESASGNQEVSNG